MMRFRQPSRIFSTIHLHSVLAAQVCSIALSGMAAAQVDYPKEIRGYKVERAVVEIKKPDINEKKSESRKEPADELNTSASAESASSRGDRLITLGKPELARVTPLGVTFDVPIVVAPVKQSGHVEFLLFENMKVNDTSVEIDEYHRAFNLPNKEALTLREPLSIYVKLPTAVLAALDEWSNTKENWPVTGRAYACGSFRKSIFSFKRCVPVEINATIHNPLGERAR